MQLAPQKLNFKQRIHMVKSAAIWTSKMWDLWGKLRFGSSSMCPRMQKFSHWVYANYVCRTFFSYRVGVASIRF